MTSWASACVHNITLKWVLLWVATPRAHARFLSFSRSLCHTIIRLELVCSHTYRVPPNWMPCIYYIQGTICTIIIPFYVHACWAAWRKCRACAPAIYYLYSIQMRILWGRWRGVVFNNGLACALDKTRWFTCCDICASLIHVSSRMYILKEREGNVELISQIHMNMSRFIEKGKH